LHVLNLKSRTLLKA